MNEKYVKLKIVFCQECRDKLIQFDESIYRLFEMICFKYSFTKKPIKLFNTKPSKEDESRGLEITSFLEASGFITTQEHGENDFLIKPNICKAVDDSEIFCSGYCPQSRGE